MPRRRTTRLLACALAASLATEIAAMDAEKVQLVEDFDATWQEERWQFSNGPEFPGAKGAFERAKDAAHAGEFGGKIAFDFTGGGNYVAAILRLTGAPDVKAVRVWVKKPAGSRLTFRYTDPGGQTLQKGFSAPDDEWTDVLIELDSWQIQWGGANDGVVHGPPAAIHFLVENTGAKQGAVFLDDVRLVPGKPVTPLWSYAAARFEAAEGWHAGASGGGAKGKLEGRQWSFDFTGGGEWAALWPREFTLLGTPKQFRIRFKGDLAGHPLRLRLGTHFMTFERALGAPAPATAVPGEAAPPEGVQEAVIHAPPGEGWKWFGGENDGRLHGPLRLNGIFLDAAGKKDAGQIELVEVRVDAECSPRRVTTMLAELREKEGGGEFVATVRSLSDKPFEAEVKWQIRNWAGKPLDEGSRQITVPPGAQPVEAAVPGSPGEHQFLEAEFSLVAPEQEVPAVQAYQVAPVPLPEGPPPLEPPSPFGMGLYLYRYPNNAKGLDEMERAARMASAAGVRWSREEVLWSWVERKKGTFDWSFYDKVVKTAQRNGIAIYGLLDYWSEWTKPYTPEGIADYCVYVEATVSHFRDDIRYWEIWNEPNIFFWQGPKDLYAELLKQSYAAIKRVAPNQPVLGCSTAGIDHGFIKRVMELGGPFDILTIHPYRAHLDDHGFIQDLRKVAELVKKPDGQPRQVWITEMGWATHVPHHTLKMDFQVTTQRKQAELIVRAYLDALVSRAAQNISWYDFRNDGTDPYNFEHNMGIVTRDFRPKPAYRAYATMTQTLKGLNADRALDCGPGVIAYRFSAPGLPAVVALWSVSGDKQVTLPSQVPFLLIGLMGDTEKIKVEGGKASVSLRNEVPVFLKETTE